jgi:hypothetical protein
MGDTNFDSTVTPPSGAPVHFQKDTTVNPRRESGYVVVADGSTKGVIQLAGDLYGSADAPLLHGVYDIGIPIVGTPDAGEVIGFTFTQAVTFPANFVGSYATSASAAAASTVFDLKKNGSSIGTVTFAMAATTGTFSTTGSVSFAPGDLFELVCPAVQDVTWANGDFTFAGTR